MLFRSKGQYNSFGKYSYRSCEDILEALKPLLAEVGAIVNISDEVKLIGNRFYVEATVKKMFGCEPKNMTKDQYNTVCDRLEKKVK